MYSNAKRCSKVLIHGLSLPGTSSQSSATPEAKALQFMKRYRPSESCMSVQTTVGNIKQAEEWDKKSDGEFLAEQ